MGDTTLIGTLILTAVAYGILSAVSLPIGAAIGAWWEPPPKVVAFALALGGGALLAALTLDLVAPGIDQGHFPELALGCALGGIGFKILDRVVNRRGGYLRKTSTAMAHWRRQADSRLADALGGMRRTRAFRGLGDEALAALVAVVQVQLVPAGTWLHRIGDPPTDLFIIERGTVELSDGATRGAVFATLSPGDVFGRLSFVTGMPRATEARVSTDATLVTIPRDALLRLLPDQPELRRFLLDLVEPEKVVRYLVERHGMAAADAEAWRRREASALLHTGVYGPAREPAHDHAALAALLRAESRYRLFADLDAAELARVVDLLAVAAVPAGHTFHVAGSPGDRLHMIIDGQVGLVSPAQTAARASQLGPGQAFGGMSVVAGGDHAWTAIAQQATTVATLRRVDLQQLLADSPAVRAHVVAFLRARGVEYATDHSLDPRRAAQWVDRASRSLEREGMPPSLGQLTRVAEGHRGAAMAMFLGLLLDGIPESFVIGANVLNTGGITLSLLSGLFLANFPEALSSSVGMREQGFSRTRIMLMWTGLCLITGLGAGIGALLLQNAPGSLFALIEGVAAGAMLTVIAETMLPEAYHRGGGVVGLSTLAGFLLAIAANHAI